MRVVVVALYFSVLGSAVWAQVAAINGEIAGTVSDPSGGAVVNAPVRIVNSGTGLRQESLTNGAGLYRFPLLPLGSYQITVTATGFKSAQSESVQLTAGAAATVNFGLEVGDARTTVSVTDAAPVVDPSRTDVGYTLSTNLTNNLPLVSRNPYNFILIQPNVAGRPNTEFGVPRKVDANGFSDRINYQIDGGNNTESDRAGIRLTPFSDTFIAEVQSVNNGFAPEFGDTVGTIFNTITKSGSNDLHGEAAYLFRRTDFSARPKLLANSQPTPETNVDTFFGNVGGRIIKDRLFYFAGVEHVKRDLPQVVTVSSSNISLLGLPASYANAIPFSQNVLFFLGKLDYQINDKNRASLRFNGHRNDSPYNNGGGLTTVSQTYNFLDRSLAESFQLISTLSGSATNELRIQVPYRIQRQLPFSATGTGPAIQISGVASFGGSPNVNFLYKEITPEVTDGFTYLVGTHSVKVGFSYRSILDSQLASNAVTYTFGSIQSYLVAASGTSPFGYTNFNEAVDQPHINYTSNFYSGFAQDDWKIRPNITFIYGARYDLYNVPSASKDAPYVLSRTVNRDSNNVAPRLGLAISLGRNQNTIIRVSSGIFYDPPQTDVYRLALLNNGTVPPINFSVGPTGQFAPAFPSIVASIQPRQDVFSVAPDFANLWSLNGNFGLTRQLTSNSALTLSYFYTRGSRIPVYANTNLLPTGRTLADGRPIFQQRGYVNPQFGNVLVDSSIGQSTYNAFNASYNQRLSRGLELFWTYTWSHAIDDAPEGNVIDSSLALPSDPTNLRRDRGNSLTDRRQAFTATSVWEPSISSRNRLWQYLAKNNRFSSIFTAYAGDVFNIGSNMDLNGDSRTSTAYQRPEFVGRNTYLGPPTYELNLRYTRLFPIRERLKATFIGEFTNIFNHDNITGVNTTARVNSLGLILTQPSFAWTSALDQRLVQLGVRIEF